mmetsp:Transcript_59605/g.154918  ORF Transcript_59605/g.154918 Transcript_59605/m.154918 type:complete len:479 (-) Transcript_59605:113-1549(-)
MLYPSEAAADAKHARQMDGFGKPASDSDNDSGEETLESQLDERFSEPFYTGLWAGISFVLSVLVLWNMLMEFVLFEKPERCLTGNAARHEYWPMYTSIFTIVLWAECWSLLLFVWTSIGCDYRKILNIRIDEKNSYVRFAAKLVIMVSLGRWVFNKSQQCKPPFDRLVDTAAYQPLILCFCIAAYVVHRFGCAIPRLILAAVASPFAAAGVTALDAYVGDVLTSLVKPLMWIAYIGCFYGTGELTRPDEFCEEYTFHSDSPLSIGTLTLLFPNVLRIAQTLRQYYDTGNKHPFLTNTGKYLCSLAITLYGLFHRSRQNEITQSHGLAGYWLYIAAMCVATLYSFLWDITMDWNLFTSSGTCLCIPYKNVRMRKRRLLGGLRPYIAASAADFVLRFFYIRNFVPHGSFSFGQKVLDTCSFFAPELEIFRRTMWSVLKMETEQLKADDKAAAAAAASLGGPGPRVDAKAMEDAQPLVTMK